MLERLIDKIIIEIYLELIKILHSRKETERSEDNGKLQPSLQWSLQRSKGKVLLVLKLSTIKMVTRINLDQPETLMQDILA